MWLEVAAGSQTQQARSFRDFDPGDCTLERDICDVSMWLLSRYQIPYIRLWIDKHRFQGEYQIACVSVIMWEKNLGHLNSVVREAFIALNYEISDTGEEIYALQCCEGPYSSHETLRAYTRVESALLL
jgi:hypothetical protein